MGSGRARPKLALAGAIVLAAGILLINYFVGIRNMDYAMGSAFLVTAGVVMLFFSLKKGHQIRLSRGMDRAAKAFKDPCQCCKCQNCGRNHNHWTHD